MLCGNISVSQVKVMQEIGSNFAIAAPNERSERERGFLILNTSISQGKVTKMRDLANASV